jgi:hypothetical protein
MGCCTSVRDTANDDEWCEIPFACGPDTHIPLPLLSMIVGHFKETHNCTICRNRRVAVGRLLIIHQDRLYLTQDTNDTKVRTYLNQAVNSNNSTQTSTPSGDETTSQSQTQMLVRAWNQPKVPSTWIPIQHWIIATHSLEKVEQSETWRREQQIWMHPSCARKIERELQLR